MVVVKRPLVQAIGIRAYLTLKRLGDRWVKAATTRPTIGDWLFCAQLLGLYALVAIPLSFTSDLLTWESADLTWRRSGIVVIRVLLFPAIIEEGIWRVALLPHKTEPIRDRQRWLIGIPVLALFVLMHPLNGLTLHTAALSTFTNPYFLSLTTLLGFICMLAYWRSGSWWVPTVIHWAIVVVWLLGFGGYAQIHP